MKIEDLKDLAAYFILNRSNLNKVISDFGDIESDNGYGTLFLKSKNPMFKVFWVNISNNLINIFSFGNPNLGITLSDIYSSFTVFREGYNRYDDQHFITVFNEVVAPKYSITIYSSDKLIEGEKIINDIPIDQIQINLF